MGDKKKQRQIEECGERGEGERGRRGQTDRETKRIGEVERCLQCEAVKILFVCVSAVFVRG